MAKNKIGLWHNLNNRILKNYRRNKIDNISQNIFFNNIFKIGYSKKIPKNISKDKYNFFIIKSFHRRYRQELMNGKIEKECLIISQNLIKKD